VAAASSPTGGLRLLVCSDLRVQSIPELIAWVRQRPTPPDLIVYAGDDTDRFRPSENVNYWSELADCAVHGLVAVRGNDDDPTSTPSIVGRRVIDLGRRSYRLGAFAFHGVEGTEWIPGEPGVGYLLKGPATITRELTRRRRSLPAPVHVIVSHSPPHRVLDEAMRFTLGGGLRSIGSRALRRMVERSRSIRLVCCGHVHLQGGQHASLGRALVVNAASHDTGGARARVAEVTLTRKGVASVAWHELQLALGFEGLPECGSALAARFRAGGIPHTKALAAAPPTQVARALGYSQRAAVPFLAMARAVTCGEPVVFAPLALPPRPRILIDIETDLAQQAVWIVGMLDEATGEFQQFVAQRDRDERALLKALTGEISMRNRPVVAWSCSRFDERTLCRAYDRHGLVPPDRLILAEDAPLSARKSVALPLPDWKLGTVALWAGFEFRHPEMDGFTIGALCGMHRPRGTPPPPAVLRYNEDDVQALATVLHRLEALAAGGLTTPESWRGLPGPRHPSKSRRRPLWPLPPAIPRRMSRLVRTESS
jgi:Icc-related predicted phosphoesterase